MWSLGITLVELATGVFPYRDCKTDFEVSSLLQKIHINPYSCILLFCYRTRASQVLSRVVQDDPPSLPTDRPFSREFRNFVNLCLTKNYKHRPKYHKLMEHPFIRKYDVPQDTNSAVTNSGYQWFCKIMRQLEPR